MAQTGMLIFARGIAPRAAPRLLGIHATVRLFCCWAFHMLGTPRDAALTIAMPSRLAGLPRHIAR